MELRSKDATRKDAQIKFKEVEFVEGMERKLCNKEGCTNQARKGGVCIKNEANVKVKRCNEQRCTNRAQVGREFVSNMEQKSNGDIQNMPRNEECVIVTLTMHPLHLLGEEIRNCTYRTVNFFLSTIFSHSHSLSSLELGRYIQSSTMAAVVAGKEGPEAQVDAEKEEEEEEDWAVLIYQDSQRRKREAAALASEQ